MKYNTNELSVRTPVAGNQEVGTDVSVLLVFFNRPETFSQVFSQVQLPRRLRRLFTMERGELTFPLRHPRHVVGDTGYKDRHCRRNAWGRVLFCKKT